MISRNFVHDLENDLVRIKSIVKIAISLGRMDSELHEEGLAAIEKVKNIFLELEKDLNDN